MSDPRIIYEFPITSRMRSFLRFEYLIDRIEELISNRGNPVETIRMLHHLLELARQNDVKSELLRHIRWQEQELQKFSDSSPVNQEKLTEVVREKQETIRNLDDLNLPLSDYMNNHFLSSIKLRLGVPGGTCNFDLPQLQAWLHFEDEEKIREFEDWFEPFRRLREALKSTLSLTRMGAEFSTETAENGCYISDLPPHKQPWCMLRIGSNTSPKIYPEVSTGPRNFTIYFLEIGKLATRPCPARHNITFDLARCTL